MHPDAQEATEHICLTWVLLAQNDPNLGVAEKGQTTSNKVLTESGVSSEGPEVIAVQVLELMKPV